MTSPISFGDAYIIAKIALRVGQAFTKGRKSAPAEFQEVDKQLYSLSTALHALRQAKDKGEVCFELVREAESEAESIDPLAIMLSSCRETLEHLEGIVKKYGCLSNIHKNKEVRPFFKRWGKDIQQN
jgi:hypothetical protein